MPAPRLPAEVHDLANRSKLSAEEIEARRTQEDSIRPRPLTPRKPAHLSTHAAEAWDHHVPELQRLGLLTMVDAAGFELAMETYAMARAALESLRVRKSDGTPDRRSRRLDIMDVDARGSTRRHPATIVFFQAQAAYLSWCRQFGMTPMGRLGMLRVSDAPRSTGAGSSDDDGDDLTGLLGY